MYKIIGTLLGLASFTVAPFLVFIWVGFTAPALILAPLACIGSLLAGHWVYALSEEQESSYVETLQAIFGLIVVLIVLVGIGFTVYDWVTG